MKAIIVFLLFIGISFGQSLDGNNSTSTVLDSGDTYTGSAKNLMYDNVASVTVTAFASHAGATSGFKILASEDSTRPDSTWFIMDSTSVTDSTLTTLNYIPKLTYYKVQYVNGSDSLTTFFIQSILHKNIVKPE
jgi:hypothetical protein